MKRARLFIFTSLVLLLVAVSAATSGMRSAAKGAPPQGAKDFVLVIHGGAGNFKNIPPERIDAGRAAMTKAIHDGYEILSHGGTSLDAVEASLRVMEESGAFDAGRGGYYTRDGVVELDAAIMDGRTLNAGAVASLQHIAHPISLARMVMERTHHVMLVGEGAEQFAKSQGMELVSPLYFYNEREWKRFEEMSKKKSSSLLDPEVHGTTGVVALDQAGNLAAGTTTGGTTLKMPGRVGDSPIIGAGTYANNDSCAISGTGVGEFYIRNVVAADICARVRYLHVSLEQAANDVVMKELVEQHGEGGVIALDRQGNVAMPFNSDGMIRAVVRSDGEFTIKIHNE